MKNRDVAEVCCNQCGDCCAPVVSNEKKKNFIDPVAKKHWFRISRKVAVAMRPECASHGKGTTFYRCDLFDPETRTCRAHEDTRPSACTAFPYYFMQPGKKLDLSSVLPRCSFNGTTIVCVKMIERDAS